MKHARKFASFLLALVMVFAMSATAFAAQEGTLDGGSITINDAVEGQTYNAYQVLYLESYNASTGAYAYKANSSWKSFIESNAINGVYVDVSDDGYVTWHKNLNCTDSSHTDNTHTDACYQDADAAAFAKLAQAYAADSKNSITADATANASKSNSGDNYVAKMENLKLGYYLVDTTLGTLCSLNTTNPNVTMEEKNEVPSIEKEVQEGNVWGSTNDASIGDTVNFRTTISAKPGAANYVLHDEMSDGLTLDANSIAVTAGSTTLKKDTDYTVKVKVENGTDNPTDSCTFEVIFKQDYLDTITEATSIVVTYSATLNSSATIGGSGNANETTLDYGNKTTPDSTPKSETKTYTWSFDVLKYANGDETKVLQGVEFVLLNSNKTKVAVFNNGKFSGWNDVPAANSGAITWPTGSTLTTDKDGKITVQGLDSGTYYLRETKALDGYNILSGDEEVKIEPQTTTDSGTGGTTMTLTAITKKIENKSGSVLPSTGGMGTTIFYVVGSILLVGAAILLIVKKRMGAEK